MVRMDKLNEICNLRRISKAVPAQVTCRILGNDEKPCVIDKLCQLTDKNGIWFYYGALLGIGSSALFLIFWFLRITRLSKVLSVIFSLMWPPVKWAIFSVFYVKELFDSLDF